MPAEMEGRGGIAENRDVGIQWDGGIKGQGENWEIYNDKVDPGAARLAPNSKTFDLFNPITQEAISNKTLNTLSVSYIRNPQSIFGRMKRYIDEAADYEFHSDSNLDPEDINSKTIHLAIPEYTSPEQWRYLLSAIVYGKERGIRIVITRIKE